VGIRSTSRILAASLLTVRLAHADREIEAQQLFEDAKKLMVEGSYEQACPKFRASQRLSPSAATLMNLAACYEANGKLATAWSTFRLAQAQAERRDPPLVEPSRARAEALRPRLSSLRIVVPQASRIAGLEIARDGAPLELAQWDAWVLVDGGQYEIVVRAPGMRSWTTQVIVSSERDRQEVEVPVLTPATRAVPAPTFTNQRKVAAGIAAGGVVALTAGVLLGLRARRYQSDSDAICPMTMCDDPEGLRLNREARTTGDQATVGLVTGGVLVAASVTLWLLGAPSPRSHRVIVVAPVVDPTSAGLALVGAL
jgi:hypothetical protein